jgi:hypothetical protein
VRLNETPSGVSGRLNTEACGTLFPQFLAFLAATARSSCRKRRKKLDKGGRTESPVGQAVPDSSILNASNLFAPVIYRQAQPDLLDRSVSGLWDRKRASLGGRATVMNRREPLVGRRGEAPLAHPTSRSVSKGIGPTGVVTTLTLGSTDRYTFRPLAQGGADRNVGPVFFARRCRWTTRCFREITSWP